MPPDPKPTPDAESEITRLTKAIEGVAERSAAKAVEAANALAADRTPSPAAPPPDPKLATEAAQKFRERVRDLINDGKADEALDLIRTSSLDPLHSSVAELAKNVATRNVNDLRSVAGVYPEGHDRVGTTRFTSERERLFYKIADKHNARNLLSDPEIVRTIWDLTKAADPTWEKENIEFAISAARADDARSDTPNLNPITPAIDVTDDMREDADRYFAADPVDRAYEIAQLQSYGISPEVFIRECRKEGNPLLTYGVGRGSYRRDIWTMIGTPQQIYGDLSATKPKGDTQ